MRVNEWNNEFFVLFLRYQQRTRQEAREQAVLWDVNRGDDGIRIEMSRVGSSSHVQSQMVASDDDSAIREPVLGPVYDANGAGTGLGEQDEIFMEDDGDRESLWWDENGCRTYETIDSSNLASPAILPSMQVVHAEIHANQTASTVFATDVYSRTGDFEVEDLQSPVAVKPESPRSQEDEKLSNSHQKRSCDRDGNQPELRLPPVHEMVAAAIAKVDQEKGSNSEDSPVIDFSGSVEMLREQYEQQEAQRVGRNDPVSVKGSSFVTPPAQNDLARRRIRLHRQVKVRRPLFYRESSCSGEDGADDDPDWDE